MLSYEQYSRDIDSIVAGRISIDSVRSVHGRRQPPQDFWEELNDWLLKSRYIFKPNQTKRLAAEATRFILGELKKPEAERNRILYPHFGVDYSESTFASNSVGRLLCHWRFTALDYIGTSKDVAVARMETLRALIALKCFVMEKGALPGTLEELVPGQLDAVPLDPFDGKPIRYSRDKKILYSIGKSREDLGGGTRKEDGTWDPPEEFQPTLPIEF